LDDGPASWCAVGWGRGGALGMVLVLLGLLGLGRRRRGVGVLLVVLAGGAAWAQGPPAAEFIPELLPAAVAEPMVVARPRRESPPAPAPEWRMGWHGYARMALRTHEHPFGSRPPYLIDDRYFESGFAYTRANESSWAELFLSAEKGRTRFVAGLFASDFSDWSQVKLEEQSGVATGYVEHTWDLPDPEVCELGLKVGVFWERMGYVEPYDTYVFGRTHIAAAMLRLRLLDLAYVRFGHGAHARVANQGFSSVSWLAPGIDLGWLDVGLVGVRTWTEDGDYEFGPLKDASSSLRVLGGQATVELPAFGRLWAAVAHYEARTVEFLGDTIEVLHATGGQKLTANYLGDEGRGTGELLAVVWDVAWQPRQTLEALAGPDGGRALAGLDVRLFGMTAHVIGEHRREDPAENRHDRRYLKWGTEVLYRPVALGWRQPFVALRYDRVILDTDHESLAFRLLSPRLGVTPTEGVDVFAAYTVYDYGDNLYAMPDVRQTVGADTRPDEQVFKLQAQVSW